MLLESPPTPLIHSEALPIVDDPGRVGDSLRASGAASFAFCDGAKQERAVVEEERERPRLKMMRDASCRGVRECATSTRKRRKEA